MLSVLVILGVCLGCPLCAQSCQPSPACKAVCAELKAEVAQAEVGPVAPVQTQSGKCKTAAVQFASTSWFALSAETPAKAANAVQNCIPENCDWSKCNPKNCDVTKCVPVNCAGVGRSAGTVRL